MESFIHLDDFTLREPSEEKDTFCFLCCELICGQAYEGFRDDLQVWIHESCTKLPAEMEHPLHPQHPLTLEDTQAVVCNRCLCFSPFTFGCQEGDNFNLCAKCAHFDHQASSEEEARDVAFLEDDSIHEHTLTPCKFRLPHNDFFRCDRCQMGMYGPSYICHDCEVYIHEVCTKLPNEIIHPRHPHPLLLLSNDDEFICNVCRDLCGGYKFSCKFCRFDVDIRCVSLMDDYSSKYDRQTLEERERKVNVDHFCHEHTLKQVNINIQKVKFDHDCCYCNQTVNGSSIYFCSSDCELYIHESCMDKMQYKIQHPYHPEHTLFPLALKGKEWRTCGACRGYIEGIGLTCEQCNFNLHYRCAEPKLIRPFKHRYHEHSLFYFRQDERLDPYGRDCCICREDFNSGFYACLICQVNFHLECIPILLVEEIKCHSEHSLKLTDSVNGFDFEEYYCDICEEIGNTKDHHYYCEECIYLAHVDCVVTKLTEASQESHGINHFSHQHALQPCYFGEKLEYNCCYCNQRINGLHNVCHDCKFFMHESCRDKIRVKEEVQHPYHPQHCLSAFLEYDRHDNNYRRICNGCRRNITYVSLWCEVCGFYLHYGCATNQPFSRPLKLQCHVHNLFYVYVDEAYDGNKYCAICNGDINGSSFYACVEVECVFTINFHLDCIAKMLPSIKIKGHNHKLILSGPTEEIHRKNYYCGVCDETVDNMVYFYRCEIRKECAYAAHIKCVVTQATRDECTTLPNTNSDTEVKSDYADQNIEQLWEKDSRSDDEQYSCFSDDQVEIHDKYIEERSIAKIPQEETSKADIIAEIAKICAGMEALVTKLDDVRASKLQSIISSYKEEIMSTSSESRS